MSITPFYKTPYISYGFFYFWPASIKIPFRVDTTSANPHEITLVDDTLDACFLENVPEKIIGDWAYDSGKLDE